MATPLSERLNAPIATQELERRWKAIRAAMAEQQIDVLLMQNNNDHMGGYVKYFTDIPATNGYPITVVFPRDDDMSMVMQGPLKGDREIPAEGDGTRRGVKRLMTTPSYASAPYTRDYDAEHAAKALEPYAGGTIGLVGTFQMSHAVVDYLKRGRFSNTKFVEASDLVDKIKVIKSDDELAMIRRTAALQDAAMKACFAAIKPGMKDSDVAALAQYECHKQGAEQGIYLCCSYPHGKPVLTGHRHAQNRTIQEGDIFALLIETNGPGGFFTELGRTCVLGQAPQELKDEFAFTLDARRFTLDRLKIGAKCGDIWNEYNAHMKAHDRPPETRLYCHGQGYDMVERPLVRMDEPLLIQERMNLVCHPTYVRGGVMSWICDNYLIGKNGPTRLHAFPEEITELG